MTGTSNEPAPNLFETVRHNCHIADARHAREYTLCIYLLKMRELFRWERGYGFADSLPKEALGDWLTNREALWEGLEESEFRRLPLAGTQIDPFESDAVNRHLLDAGLVYSGGLGAGGRPHFFLADLLRQREHEGFRILVAGREYARDITAPPAMLQGRTIFVRSESLRRMLWEKIEEWQWKRQDGPMARAMAAYPFATDFECALGRMTEAELDSVVLHEMGEVEAGRILGPTWEEMLATAGRSRFELTARAARDHLADSLLTLPMLLQREAFPQLHFYFANLGGMRKALVPGLYHAYEDWVNGAPLERLTGVVDHAAAHWRQATRELLARRLRDAGFQPAAEDYAL